jgi:HEAT repeat protein
LGDEITFDSTDEHALQLALRAIKMTERDLGFSKTNVEAELIFPEARRFLQHPLDLPAHATTLIANLNSATNLNSLLPAAAGTTEILRPAQNDKTGDPLARAIQLITTAARRVQPLLPKPDKAAFDAYVLEACREDFNIAPDLLRRADALELQDTELADAILAASDRFDRTALLTATRTLAAAVDQAVELLRASGRTGEFQTESDSEFGKIIIGGTGANTYTNDAFLIIDLGGDDIYLNSAGGANGLAGQPISIVIDLAGHDQFISKRSFSQGSGVFGIGILAALGSNGTFQAKHFSQGAGFFGCGLLMTGEGQQTFEADTFCQGAGMFGTGILWQRGGDTTYTGKKFAQGFGGVQGVGLLLDVAGNDSYLATGKEPCGWLPGHYFTLSQGFGYGMRPFAGGGIGILCDLQGNDRYKADVYGQGASYWYAVGLLLDAAGNDTYEAHQYCQGAGIHLSTGALIDWSGDDTYTAGQICQGAAHDYSVGMLIDRAGNDRYTGNTTAQGSAINNSFALLLDRAGNDRYTGTDPKQSQAAGHDGDKRQYGSIALLLDLAGNDTYSQGQSNNAAWLKPWYGAGLDSEAGRAGVSPVPISLFSQHGRDARATTGRLYTSAPVDPHHPIERLFRVATSDRPEAGAAWEQLKNLGTEALPYLISRLASPNVMVRVKVEQLVDHLDTNSIPVLIAGIRSTKDDEVARLCCYYLARFNEKARAAIPAILPLLDRDKTRTTAFYTLGHLRAREAFAPAIRALNDPKELIRLRATQALGKICAVTVTNVGAASRPRLPAQLTASQHRAVPCLLRQLDDDFYNVRYAAQDALIAFGPAVRDALHDAYRKATPRARPHILEALAKLGDTRALPLAREFYRNDEPVIRQAVLDSLLAK